MPKFKEDQEVEYRAIGGKNKNVTKGIIVRIVITKPKKSSRIEIDPTHPRYAIRNYRSRKLNLVKEENIDKILKKGECEEAQKVLKESKKSAKK